MLGYLLATDKALASAKDKLNFNERLLEDKELFICFKKGERGEKLAAILAEGLQKIDVQAIMQQHLQ